MIWELIRIARVVLALAVVAAGSALLLVGWLVVGAPLNAVSVAFVLVAMTAAALVAFGHRRGRRWSAAVMIAGVITLTAGAGALGSGIQSGLLTGDFEYWAIMFALLLLSHGLVTVAGLYFSEGPYLTPPADPRVT